MNGRRIILKALVCIVFAMMAILLFYYITSRFLTVTYYSVSGDFKEPVRIVQLTDLHNAEFGTENKDLVTLVEKQEPDLIFMTGDMLNRDDADLEVVEDLITELVTIAPVYYGYGNHETSWEKTFHTDLHLPFSECGAIVLDNEYIDLDIKGNPVRIAGYMGYYWQPHMTTKDEAKKQLEKEFFRNFQDTERYKILLNHIPTQWVDWNYIDKCSVDLVFCGHYHGGIIRIPIIDQGLAAPYIGWFPPNTKGKYVGSKATCILSTGLGSEHILPRLNNPPEVVVTDLIPR